MEIVFFGSGEFGRPTLARLAREHRVLAVVTQPDRPAGRGGRMTPTPIAGFAAERLPGVEVLKPERVNEAGVVERIRSVPAATWVVIAFGQKLGRALLADWFAINLHASLLPRWRGAAPINAAILAGDRETGNSVITLADRMDAGLVLGQTTREIEPAMTAGELHDLLAADGPDLVLRVLAAHERGETQGWAQDESRVTIAPKLSKADGWVDFGTTALECRRRVHGLSPWPGVAVRIGGEPVKLGHVEAITLESESAPGALVDADRGVVACAGGSGLRLIEVQPAGGRMMSWEEYARGRRPEPGARVAGGRDPC